MRTLRNIFVAAAIALSTFPSFGYAQVRTQYAQVSPSAQLKPPQITVDEHPGGVLDTQQRWMKFIAGSGATLRFIGICSSSCTLGLGMPYACVEPSATFGFHLFAYDFGKSYSADLTMAWYRRWVPKLVLFVEELKLTPAIQLVAASVLVEKGIISWCEHEQPAAAVESDVDEDDPDFILRDAHVRR